ncbi:hypothetical protein CAEBREN_31369, partial [Caenorhabditis brenneri]
MSRDVSLSPKSAEIRYSSAGTANEPIRVEVVDEEQAPLSSQLGFSTTLSTSFVAADDLSESIDDLTITKVTAFLPHALIIVFEEKKKLRPSKVAEDITRKRKDTTNSISNFFHRFTRGDREEKKIVEEEEEEHIERPGKLISPESEEKWFESRTLDEQVLGHEADAQVYEWDPNNMTETLVREPLPLDPNNVIFEEKGMLKLLEDFRNGELRWLDEPQISAMRKVKEAHEDVSDIHLKVYEIESAKRKKRKQEARDRSNFDFKNPLNTLANVAAVSNNSYLNPKFVVDYLYNGACILIELKRFQDALFLLETLVAIPAFSLQETHGEGYKKYVLVSLLINGRVPETNEKNSAARNFKSKTPEYRALSEIKFSRSANTHTTVEDLVLGAKDKLRKDNNLELAKLLVVEMKKKTILCLTKMFTSIRLAEIQELSFLKTRAQVTELMEQLVEENRIAVRLEGEMVF